MSMAHLELKKKLLKVGLFGDVYLRATASLPLEMKATLLIIGRRYTLVTCREFSTKALRDLEAVSVAQCEMLLELLEELLSRPRLRRNDGPAHDAWRKEHGAAALALHEQETG